ncbi:hypothetical protein [Candidatus Villigracilis affinis]|uniref:hypothetical protein n=1 Tax=Candidatus Villigracilis affinis TaxID=3140682 RepID=UPI0031EF3E85
MNDLARQMLMSKNPNGRPNSDVVRPYLMQRYWPRLQTLGLLILDLMPLEEAAHMKRHLNMQKKVVNQFAQKYENTDTWWQFDAQDQICEAH